MELVFEGNSDSKHERELIGQAYDAILGIVENYNEEKKEQLISRRIHIINQLIGGNDA